MVLEELDRIDWGNLTHAYGSASDIPDLLRNLEQAETSEEFGKYLGEIANNVNHQGSIYSATPFTVPFLLQLLNHSTELTRKTYCLYTLSSIVGSTQLNTFTFSYPAIRGRLGLQIYDAVSAGIDTYITLLSSDDLETCAGSIYLLSFLVEQHERILPTLIECVARINHPWVQAGAIWAYTKIVYYTAGFYATSYLDQLLQWVQSTHDPLVRYAAALGYLYIGNGLPESMITAPRSIPNIVVRVAGEALEVDVWAFARREDQREYLFYVYDEFTPFDDIVQIITHNCRAVMRPQLWIAILRQISPSPLQAHIYVRELLDVSFSRASVSQAGWANHRLLDPREADTPLQYMFEYDARRYRPGEKLIDFQRFALETVVACDPFWEIPTNLFSFFYGLPDERDVLRSLI